MTTETINDDKATKPSSTRAWVLLAIGVFIIYLLFTPDVEPIKTTSTGVAVDLNAQREALKTHFNGAEEPTTQYANWAGDGIFLVAELDNQGNRDGYAQYVCQTITDFQLNGTGITVQIIKANNKSHKLLGYARCK